MRWGRFYKAGRPLLIAIVFLLHTFLMVTWAGGVIVLVMLAFRSSLGIVPMLMVGTAAFMAWALSLHLPEYWSSWFVRRRA